MGRTCNALYLQPLVNYSEGRWYKDSAIGVNKLQKTVKSMWERAGLQGFFSNHSLRATSATHMYNACNDEQVIQKTTGHRSLAVRSYKKTFCAQKRQASASLYCSEAKLVKY